MKSCVIALVLLLAAMIPGGALAWEYPTTPGDLTPPLEFVKMTIVTPDSARLATWYVPAQDSAGAVLPGRHPGVLVLPGDRDVMDERLHVISGLARRGFSVLTFDHRGRGGSSDFFIDRRALLYPEFLEDAHCRALHPAAPGRGGHHAARALRGVARAPTSRWPWPASVRRRARWWRSLPPSVSIRGSRSWSAKSRARRSSCPRSGNGGGMPTRRWIASTARSLRRRRSRSHHAGVDGRGSLQAVSAEQGSLDRGGRRARGAAEPVALRGRTLLRARERVPAPRAGAPAAPGVAGSLTAVPSQGASRRRSSRICPA